MEKGQFGMRLTVGREVLLWNRLEDLIHPFIASHGKEQKTYWSQTSSPAMRNAIWMRRSRNFSQTKQKSTCQGPEQDAPTIRKGSDYSWS
jgi:hypothetical protein